MSDHPTLFVRTDGGAHIGLGHVTRCVALARAWRARGGSVTFLTADSPTELRTTLQAEGFAVESLSVVPGHGDDAKATVAADRGSRRVMLVDGYRFDAAFRRRVRAGVDRLIVIDDALEPVDYDADVVINPNLYARGPALTTVSRISWSWPVRDTPSSDRSSAAGGPSPPKPRSRGEPRVS